MKKKKLFKSIIASAAALLGMHFGISSTSSVWIPTGEFHECLCIEAFKQYREGMGIGYIIDSIANTGIDVSSYNPDVASYWKLMYELCREIPKDGKEKSGNIRFRETTKISGDDELKYWESFAKHYGIDMGDEHIYSMNQIPDKLRRFFLKKYKENDGFKMNWSLYPEDIKDKWPSFDINTRIKIAKIYAVSTYLDMIHIGLSKKLFSDIKDWQSYDEIDNWVNTNIGCHIRNFEVSELEKIYNTKQYAIDKIREIISWPN